MTKSQLLGFLLHLSICFTIISSVSLDNAKGVLEQNSSKEDGIAENNPELNLLATSEHVYKFNKGVDKVLGFINGAFAGFEINLPDVDKKIGHPPFSGTFKATDGYFKDPSSLTRTGDVEVIFQNQTSITLVVQLGFKVAEAGYVNYNLDIINIHLKGNVKVSITHNSVSFKLTLTYSPSCIFKLDELKFDELKDIKIVLTGLGPFQPMLNELLPWLTSNFEQNGKEIINKKIYEKANEAIAKKNICKYFPRL